MGRVSQSKARKMAYCAGFQLVGDVMKILLLGKDGQVGWQLQRSLAPHGDVVACGRNECDLSDVDRIRSVVREVAPSIIVNATAYTAVDKAESEPELAAGINAVAPGVLAEEAKRLGRCWCTIRPTTS
jgi:dTDP-4-dehydrorhamnose reductase